MLGHAVFKGSAHEVYVMPIQGTLDHIKKGLDCEHVRLPTREDIEKLKQTPQKSFPRTITKTATVNSSDIRQPQDFDDEHSISFGQSFRVDSRSSSLSEWTVTDRGEDLYTLANHSGNTYNCEADATTPNDAADILLALFRAKCHERDYMDIRRGFFPNGSLDRIITMKVVVGVLTKAAPHLDVTEIEYYASRICHNSGPQDTEPSYRKMFTILLLIQQPVKIIHFIKYGLSDRDLPLVSQPSAESPNIFELRRRKAPDTRLPQECFERFDILTAGNFDGWQWSTIAPYFAKGPKGKVRFYTLSDKDIMPWTKKDKGNWGGGFSTVYRVTIHEAHHDFKDSEASYTLFLQVKLN